MVEGGKIDGGGGGCLKELEFVNLFLKNRARRLFFRQKGVHHHGWVFVVGSTLHISLCSKVHTGMDGLLL